MDTDGCRLCLDPFAENDQSIENPELKQKLEQVFHFSIDPMEGYSNSVCQSCSYTVSEFYQFSEKVRVNQEQLSTGYHSKINDDSKLTIEEIKVEPNVQLVCPEVPEEVTSDTTVVEKKEKRLRTVVKKQEPQESDYDSSGESCQLSGGENSSESEESPDERPQKKRKSRAKSTTVSDEFSQRNKTKEELEEEDKQILEFYKMACDLCGDAGTTFASLNKHFQKVHERAGYVVCCKKKLTKRRFLLEHMALHVNPDAFRCEVCNKSYKDKSYLATHRLKAHGNEDERPFKCDHCPQSYGKKFMLRAHLTTHEKVQCPTCGRTLASKGALKTHIKNMHSDTDRRMICDTCGQEFLNKASFDRHVKEHMGIEVVKKFQCHICHEWLRGAPGLKQHIRNSHHEKAVPHVCDICHKNYPNPRGLAKHKKVVHVEENYECEFCGKRFKQAVNLKEHRATHTGQMLYSCEVCGVAKNSRSNLYVHVKTIHPLEWAAKKQKKAEANVPTTQS